VDFNEFLNQKPRMDREHAAWLDVGIELKKLGLDMDREGGGAELTRAIHLWGEELAQLRMHDHNPDHAVSALAEKRGAYPGQYERGAYPDEPSDA
jgi:hypothetical protein